MDITCCIGYALAMPLLCCAGDCLDAMIHPSSVTPFKRLMTLGVTNSMSHRQGVDPNDEARIPLLPTLVVGIVRGLEIPYISGAFTPTVKHRPLHCALCQRHSFREVLFSLL